METVLFRIRLTVITKNNEFLRIEWTFKKDIYLKLQAQNFVI